jgi:outer membrane receptor protein involved in Fe transport
LTQMKDGNRLRASLSGKVGAEWYPSPSEVLSVSVNFSGNESTRTGTTLNDEDWDTGYLLSTERADTNDSKGAGQDVDVSYRKEFENNPSHFFRAMVRHSNSDSDNENFIIESLRGLDGMSIADTNIQHTARIRTVAQIDFEKPLPNEGKWEWGLKSNISNSTDEYVYLSPDSSVWENGLYVPINAQRSGYDFNYHEEVHAAYSTFGRKWGVWGVQSGLRLEQVFTSATITGEDPFKNDYFSVYPSFNISRQRSDEVSWIGSYSRRVNRPRGRQVSPFIDDRDNRNIRTGNPELRPEYTHSMEFGHQWSKGRKSITTSLFVKQTNDVIRRFSTVDEAGISTSSYLNLDARRDEGLEVVAMSSLGRGGSFRFTGSVYHLANSVGDVENASDNEGWSYSANVFANKSFGTDGLWKWQVNGMHRGPSVTAQGQFNGFTFADASVQRKLFDGDLTITLKLSDVFNTRQWSYSSDFQRLYQESTYKRESQNLFLTISWNLGKLEAGKGRTGRPSSGGASGGMDGVDF